MIMGNIMAGSLLIIRLHPAEPVAGDAFTSYISNLLIEAYDVSIDDPDGNTRPPFDRAASNQSVPQSSSQIPIPGIKIVQHAELLSTVTSVPYAVATAVIKIPDDWAVREYRNPDVRLKVSRAGKAIYEQTYYNVSIASGNVPELPSEFPGLLPVGLYIPLLPPEQTKSDLVLPENGAMPKFSILLNAVKDVLKAELGVADEDALVNIRNLDFDKCRHIAHEIIWDNKAHPLPGYSGTLESIYTVPGDDNNRRLFEGNLLTYYSGQNAKADKLANFVFSLSAAVFCEEKSKQTKKVGYEFPIINASTQIILDISSGPFFLVSAAYLYALTAVLPPQISKNERFKIATSSSQNQALVSINHAFDDKTLTDSDTNGINIYQAVRRLQAIGYVKDVHNSQSLMVVNNSPVFGLVTDWLKVGTESIDDNFWNVHAAPLLDLALYVITKGYKKLEDTIKDPNNIYLRPVSTIGELATKNNKQWESLFNSDITLLPDFTEPGTTEERIQAFVSHLRGFFGAKSGFDAPLNPPESSVVSFDRQPDNPLDQLLSTGFLFSSILNKEMNKEMSEFLSKIFSNSDKNKFYDWLYCIKLVYNLTEGIEPAEVRFSVMEALWARGLNTKDIITEFASLDDFEKASIGSFAYGYAGLIWNNAGSSSSSDSRPKSTEFKPVNPNRLMVSCIPPAQLSPFSPVAYLHEMLRVHPGLACDDLLPDKESESLTTIGKSLAGRQRLLGNLLATRANLETTLPLIDIVNELLEHIAADDAAANSTSEDAVGGHELTTTSNPTNAFKHDPVILLEALPEHSTPTSSLGYGRLENNFSSCALPYSQRLDVSRKYLEKLGTNRYHTVRCFSKRITEFVIDPTKEPPEFQNYLWRYPVQIDVAIEYLEISPEEYNILFQDNITNTPSEEGSQKVPLYVLYGFDAKESEGWYNVVVRLSEFLQRTCLSYCEFIELQKSKFVKFSSKSHDKEFSDCEPCCLEKYVIVFESPESAFDALKQLIVFIRLWRKLQATPNAGYTFTELSCICNVFGLFVNNSVNSDFIRQLIAFQMLRDDFGDTGANRTCLLSLWVDSPNKIKRNCAIEYLLHNIQKYANTHHCRYREPEFIKLLISNLGLLSNIAGFGPTPTTGRGDTWYSNPSCTLRFSEILAKICASKFGIGELFFLFTNAEHLQGNDPFPLPALNEAKDRPFDLPDDDKCNSLLALRQKLIMLEVSIKSAVQWTWVKMSNVLEREFGLTDNKHWLSLGQHFFPSVLTSEGISTSITQRQYRLKLDSAAPLMWNTPFNGPFQYDLATKELFTELPLTDEAVLSKISRIRQLLPHEQYTVRDLYFSPRRDLAPFVCIIGDFEKAERHLIHESDEDERWSWFQQKFDLFYKRCRITAEHLASHAVCNYCPEDVDTAKLVLKYLWADENFATAPWENDIGNAPEVTWKQKPSGGAFAAMLGLTGTGLLAEYYCDSTLRWRKICSNTSFFDNDIPLNSPVPTILPSMEFKIQSGKSLDITVRNGFAMRDFNGAILSEAEPFELFVRGFLLIEHSGQYEFSAGIPVSNGEMPKFTKAYCRWQIVLEQGQRTWVLIAYNWKGDNAPEHCSSPIRLKKGFYRLKVKLEYKPLKTNCEESIGFQIKYNAPEVGIYWLTIPRDKLFIGKKDAGLQSDICINGEANTEVKTPTLEFLTEYYTSSVRDIRHTYQRSFKAMLLVSRFRLSSQKYSDDGQSELEYMLNHPSNFVGQSYYRDGDNFVAHKANLDLNFLPILDDYLPLPDTRDQRARPALKRQQAMFDWWERLFDYTVMRREVGRPTEQPVWLLFHESAELHPDVPADLVRHMGIDLRHDKSVSQYYFGSGIFEVKSLELKDERWAIRVWHSEKWIRVLLKRFHPKDISEAKPSLWVNVKDDSANANLTLFYRRGCIENGEPRRYRDIKVLNDKLRQRGREALLAYFTHHNKLTIKNLSESLLIDVEAGLCQKASRIDNAISTVQLFVQRARLGLEPSFDVSPSFIFSWDRRFATFHTWKDCKQRVTYQENWIEWNELQKAEKTEATRFLESELRNASLTIPVPGGETYWSNLRPPAHSGVDLIQHIRPAIMQFVPQQTEGLNLMGTPDRHARLTWLAPVTTKKQSSSDTPRNEVTVVTEGTKSNIDIPMWLQGAIRLGTKFIRVAAASKPPSITSFEPKCNAATRHPCCNICNKIHPTLIDEYYFWTEKSEFYNTDEVSKTQVANLSTITNNTDWHNPKDLPGLLNWSPQTMVHLHWCRVHNGEFQQPCRSYEGVWIDSKEPQLIFLGRTNDSLLFRVDIGKVPIGIPTDSTSPPGFRYDIPINEATVIPQVAKSSRDSENDGGLSAFPYFAWFDPGLPLLPPSTFVTGILLSRHLRIHCCFEDALKWYELFYNPLYTDNTWHICSQEGEDDKKCCCYSDPVSQEKAKDRAVLLHYLDTLLQWGDALMRKNTPEYFQQARLVFDTLAKILGHAPTVVEAEYAMARPVTVGDFKFDSICSPINPRLMRLYTDIDDRLALIHKCMGTQRLINGCANISYFGNNRIMDYWKTTKDVCCDEFKWCMPRSSYRFTVLLQKALEIANDVRSLGGALLSAYEKGDVEYLSTMRTMHEQQLLNLTIDIRKNQWRESDWQVQALQKTKETLQANLRYYTGLVNSGLNNGEAQYEPLTVASTASRTAGNTVEAIGQISNIIPDPYVGFPCNEVKLFPGTKSSMSSSSAGRVANTIADILNTASSLGLTQAGWDRRLQEWTHQTDVLPIDIEQTERQILAAERRRDYALRELNNAQQQIENAAKVSIFIRDKLTSHSLYLWIQQETAAMHCKMCELALESSLQAQYAYNFERGHTAAKFIHTEMSDELCKRLLFGEQLQLSLRRMEKTYYDENIREYELTKHISLSLYYPVEFLQLKITGCCEIEIPEWVLDLDYPGHYMRRLKNVTMTVPCVVGPYTGIHCRLTLLSSKTRVGPELVASSHTCCSDINCKDEYQAKPDDPRIVSMYAATEAIATSNGQNDSGMFELNFRDERYLPFEFSGAISRWRIELPLENNFFERETLSDLILHLNFMAREGGEHLRQIANKLARQKLSCTLLRLFDVKHEFSNSWHRFCDTKRLKIQLNKNMFPYISKCRKICIQGFEIFFEKLEDDQSAQHTIKFAVEEENCDVCDVVCVASADWPDLFHGTLKTELGTLNMCNYRDIGELTFPTNIRSITNFYLLIKYRQIT